MAKEDLVKKVDAYLNRPHIMPKYQEMARLAAQEHIGAVKEIDHLM